MTERIKVLIADDHGVVREGLRAMLEREGMQVVGLARDGREAIGMADDFAPDVVLLDIRMPDIDGLQALVAIKSAHPETSVVMLTSHANPGYLARAVSHGAAGFLSKDVEPERIPAAVRAAATGDHLLDPALLRAALLSAEAWPSVDPATHPADQLTDAETRVLRLLADGLDNETLAASLNLSINTVKTHVRHIFEKIRVSDRTQAALWAIRHGMRGPHLDE